MIWEYITATTKDQPISAKELISFGMNGWELVAAYEYETSDVKYYFHYIFKRPKE